MQCTKLAHNLNFQYISIGDLLREKRARTEFPFSDFISESIKESVIISTQLIISLLDEKIRLSLQYYNKSSIYTQIVRINVNL
jgi:adenylate kinase family enzyme